jgi:hypothetical protein
MKAPNCCARDVKVGDRIWLPTGVVTVEKLEPSHGGLDIHVKSQGSGGRVLWWWLHQGVHVVKRARRGQGKLKTASGRA